MNKILQIGLVFGIISALQLGLGASGYIGLSSLVSVILSFAFTFFLYGYGIRVIRSVWDGNNALPDFAIGSSIGNGFRIGLATLLYMLPIILIFTVVFFVIFSMLSTTAIDEIMYSLNYPGYEPQLLAEDEAAIGGAALLFCGLLIVALPITLILSFALQIGMVRFAVEEDRGALFQVWTNIKLMFRNFGKIAKLFVLQLVLGMSYGVISLVIGGVFGIFGGETMYTESYVGAGMFVIASMVLLNIVSQILGAMQQMSNLHLLAGLADDANFGGKSKIKNDYDFGDDDFTF